MGLQRKLGEVIRGLEGAGAVPGDTERMRFRKALLTMLALFATGVTLLWGLAYALLGFPHTGLIFLAYALMTTVTLLHFFMTKYYALFRFLQLAFLLFLPFLVQWSLGGFVASSGIIGWAMLSPLGMLASRGMRQSLPWLFAYLFLIVLSGIFELFSAGTGAPVPLAMVTTFAVLNITGISVTVYVVLRYFVEEREHALDILAEQHRLLALEQERSERLLLNILPEPIALRLKSGHQLIADGFPEVTVLFADIAGFTTMSARLTPADVLVMLNEVFSAMDRLVEQHGLEKIKTIGDAYMAVGGLPVPRPDHAEAVAEMALHLMAEMNQLHDPDGRPLTLRVGINTGPAVAGVIGLRKFSYDLWGDTVNIASRMESQGQYGAFQVSAATYERLREWYDFEERGMLEVRGRGPMTTYFLVGKKPHVAMQSRTMGGST